MLNRWKARGSCISLRVDPGLAESDLHGRLCYSVRFVRPTAISGKRVLDIGCGAGWFISEALSDGAHEIVGIDLNPDNLTLLRKSRVGGRVHLVRGGATDLPFKSASFDTVVAWEVLEHVPRGCELAFISEIRRVMKPDGVAYLSTPNSVAMAVFADPARWLIGHRHYAKSEVVDMAQRCGLRTDRSRVEGGLGELLMTINMYISKWILNRRPVLENQFARLTDRDYEYSPGFVTIFVELSPTG
jgi:SAM-dependent methyltransferase